MRNKYMYDANPVGVETHSVGVRSALGRPLVGGGSGWVNRAASRAVIGLQPDCDATERKTHIEGQRAILLSRVPPASARPREGR